MADIDDETSDELEELPSVDGVESPQDDDEPEPAPDPSVSADTEDDEPDYGEGLLDPENGKLLGKFNDTPALARSYKELESTFGRTSGQAAEYKRALEAQGYTFDDDGKPVAPKASVEPAPVEVLPANSSAISGQQVINGVLHDHLGMPVVSEDEWSQLEDENPSEYQRLRNQYDTLKIIRQEDFNRQQSSRQGQELEQTKQNVRVLAKEKYFLDDASIAEIETEVQSILAHVHPSVRNSPQAYEMAARAVAADKMPAIYQKQLQEVMAGNKDAGAKAQKVVALEKGSVNAPAAPAAAGYGLSAIEKQMAKDLGVSEKDYAANK